ncbi:hypothetical protein [Clostridium magnum]|uniref:Uncharacterized protein n=1 Tax=Clostridium magnum DSM 2767 TaxID=1121326 RepID=A0A161X7E3_9CLOT|nr:hypothetical protein [Clostridium magnum]KZL90036.1 hypothetical protein CLMAG_45220 [Clostridium magnum DSM 2767]SHH58034.1 hypothetical protein SAMN02745944_00898 [Clostridium magnum DSM 2767]
MTNKVEGTDLQHDMRKRNNKPGSKFNGLDGGKVIREGKQIVKTQD